MDLNLNDPEKIKELIAVLQNLLPKNEEDIEKESKIKTKTSRATKQNNKNKFLNMPERNMHKSDSEIDKKLSTHPPTPRNRKFKPVDVICRTCGRKEKVSPSVVPEAIDRYRCNKCSSSSGG